jgi:O-antigen/teichoic acid export membrane protein
MSIRSSSMLVATNAAALAASKVLTSVALLVWQVALARALGAGDYGVYGTISALMAVGASIPDLGIGSIVVREVARAPERASNYFAAAVALHAMLAIAAYAVLQGAALLLGYDADLRLLLAFVGINLFVDALGTAGHNLFVARERMAWTAVISISHVVVLVALVAGVWRSGAYWAALRRHGWTPLRSVDRGLARRLIASGFPLGISAFLSLGLTHADKLATTAIIGAEATGQFMAAFVIVFGFVELLGVTPLVAAYPLMARAGRDVERGGPNPVLEHLVFFDLLCGVPLAALLTILGPAISTFAFGAAFAGSALVFQVMGWCIVTRTIEGALAQSLIIGGHQTAVLRTRAGGLLVNLTLTVALLPRLGVVGAAIGMLVGEIVIIGAALGALALPSDWWTSVARRAARLLVPLVALVIVSLSMRERAHVLAALASALAVYAAAGILTKAITKEYRDAVADVLLSGGRGVRSWMRAGP